MKRLSIIPLLGLGLLAYLPASADTVARGGEPTERRFDLQVDKPGGLAFDGELLWVADRVALKLRGLDPVNGRERKILEAPGPWPSGMAFDGTLLWVADRSRNRLFGVDPKRSLVVKEIESPNNPLGVAFDGVFLWVADGKKLHQVSPEDGTTIVSINAPTWGGQGRATEQLGLAFDKGYLWVSDRNRNMIYRVQPDRGDVVDLFPAPGPLAAGLAVVHGKLLVADVDLRRVDSVAIHRMPQVVRRNPRREVVILRRKITNQGPGRLVETNVYVAIPSSGPGQALNGTPQFQPAPTDFTEDKWGQKLAHFQGLNLGPNQSLELTMTVKATLFDIRYHIDPDRVGTLRDIPQRVKGQYLQDASKYMMTHPSIRKHLKDALGDETRPYWMVRKIARYIQDRMHYEMVGGWNVAPTVIDRGSGSCSEYTFVFISMCRAAGIPARYSGALVVRGDDASTDEVFHRWAEVYLPGYGWIPADAQGGDKPAPEQQGQAIGSLSNRFVITTIGGGDSEYIHWDYNSFANWICSGRCEVKDLHLGDWYPADRAPMVP